MSKPKSSNKTQWSSWPKAEKPMERIHVDFAGPMRVKYLLTMVDAFSHWPEVFVKRRSGAEIVEYRDVTLSYLSIILYRSQKIFHFLTI